VTLLGHNNHTHSMHPLTSNKHINDRAKEGMEGRPRTNQEVAEPSGQRLGGSVILEEGLRVYVSNEGGDRRPLSFTQHGDLSWSNLLDPLGRSKESARHWNDKGWKVPIVFDVSLWWHVEGFLVVFDLVLQTEDVAVKPVFFELLLLGALLDGGCQPSGDVGGEGVVWMLNIAPGLQGWCEEREGMGPSQGCGTCPP